MDSELIDRLKSEALGAGASDVQLISADMIVVDEELGKICCLSKCPGYGSALSCPPHAMKPEQFKEILKDYEYALVIKFDIPMRIFNSDERYDFYRHAHELLTNLEIAAAAAGHKGSRGFAGGSCKELFCSSDAVCEALKDGGTCKHPDLSRPSASGLGVNFNELNKKLGWEGITSGQDEAGPEPMGMLESILLIG
ncbi:MAG: DUF2284 domain-containing protein [Actinobacteria bacterium]|nr:DUF2284 domain-containing protein [Actinomycetota bacterium]